ncbi:hypothetical protein GCM10007887_28360 [Methylobacterium haplocladii]|uniref:Uncharacterized protein n=2 Tax=Methylobacterium haplocladii TaxID=1176176 RepID=A0A512IQ08_9HYPH|nr:hypothetical protein MHA02_21530 [Methylobacterium haplocladii]GLS60158.1 hypothetical protein GCM10007887_28360 [Methylobacterium haplocladii]
MSDTHEETLTPVTRQPPSSAPNSAPKPKLTAREARRRRRKSRRRGEEILGWILVPIIVFGVWWGVNAGFEFFGTTPGTVWDQLMMVKKQLEKKV